MSVYTTLNKSDLTEFLNAFDVGVVHDLRGISDGIENTNYFLTTVNNSDKNDFVLTIFESLSHEELPFFLNLMAFLAEHGVPCAHPVADRAGRYLQRLKSKPAAVVQRLRGRSIAAVSEDHCRQVGSALARLHLAGKSFPQARKNPRAYPWFEQAARRLRPRLSTADQRLLMGELSTLQYAIKEELPGGIIHADLFRDNVLFEQDRLVGIIDFYYACSGAWLYDLAITINDWCSNADGSLKTDYAKTLLQSYHAQRALTEQEHAYWPIVLRAAALRFWLSRLCDLHFPRRGEITHTKNPDEFKHILEHHIRNREPVWIQGKAAGN
ncbi:MAG TPA: homoserine kinase [Gammaproteobacteria bacterium]|nr:homoserine kinase [Gammaproteobacteria bacterium]